MTDLSSVDQTRSSRDVVELQVPTRTRTISDLVEDAGWLRNRAHGLTEDAGNLQSEVGDIHHQAIEAQLADKTHQFTAKGAIELLGQLSDAGFSWRDISRMVGVSVP